MSSKTCSDCSSALPLTDFYSYERTRANGKTYTGYSTLCKKHHTAKANARKKEKGYVQKPKPKADSVRDTRKHRIKRVYGMTVEEYDQALTRPCAVCGDPSKVMDHCHATGVRREALCASCNLMLGHGKDSPERLRAAAAYLERHTRQP